MRKFMIATGAAALLAATSFSASALEIKEAITGVDAEAGTITLASGQTLKLPEGYDAGALAVGELVSVEYDPGSMMIDEFEVVTDGDVLTESDDTNDGEN